MINEVERIVEAKLDTILDNPLLQTSLVIHLDAHLLILEFIDSDNDELRSKIEKMIDKSCQSHIKKID